MLQEERYSHSRFVSVTIRTRQTGFRLILHTRPSYQGVGIQNNIERAYDFPLKFLDKGKEYDGSKYKQFTRDTEYALHGICYGIVDLVRYPLKENKSNYFQPGKFTTNIQE